MLQSLGLENFKAFGERAHILFAPITLIFGENSAGKSSILQALCLLKQTLEKRDTGDLLLARTPNHIVDLGSFQEMLFDHDLERTLSIRVETSVDRRYLSRLLFNGDKIAIEFSFKRLPSDQEVLLEQIGIYDEKSDKCLAKFEPLDRDEISREFQRRSGFFRDSRGLPISVSELKAVKCVWLTEDPEHWKREFKWCLRNREEILEQLKDELNDLKHSSEELRKGDESFSEEINSLEDSIKFFSLKNFDLETYISRRHSEQMDIVVGIQGFLPVGIVSRKKNPIIYLHFPGSQRYDRILFDVAQLAIVAGRALEQTLESLFPISPFRIPPERLYTFRGTTPQNVGYQGDLLPDLLFRSPKLVQDTNGWLNRLNIDYKLEVERVGTGSGDLFEVRLMDARRKKRVVKVALPDVGFGISQLLPFVVQSLVPGKQIISIEQPEVHVHPRLQADLGALLAKAIKEHQKQFIVETHSEHLILRLQRLIRKQQLKPEDVSVIYVSRKLGGAKAERLRLDEDGDFIDDWPNGFFPERLREL